MSLSLVVVINPEDWHAAIVRAVREVDEKADVPYPVDECVAKLETRIRAGETIVLLALDMASGKGTNESVCGMCVVDFTVDFLGSKVALLTYGWIDAKYGRKVFDLALPAIKAMAKEQQCKEVWFFTYRNAEAFEKWCPEGFKWTHNVHVLTMRLT